MQEKTGRITDELRQLAHEHHGSCSICNRLFKEGDTTHWGYSVGHSPIYVGDCCSSKLRATAVRYCFAPRAYDIPAQDARLWRYMDFTKFVSLLRVHTKND